MLYPGAPDNPDRQRQPYGNDGGPVRGGPAAPPVPFGPCPDGTPAGPAPCCPAGTVWRTDTKQCEAPDARSKAGKETCPEPSPGPNYWCDFDTGTWKGGGGGGGGAGGGGGGGGGAKPAAPPGFDWTRFNKLLAIGGDIANPDMEYLNKIINGQTRYSPEVMQWLAGQSRAGAEAQVAQGTQALNEELASRGVARGPLGATLAGDVRNRAEQTYSGQIQQNRIAKVNADFQDKLEAIDRQLKYVNDLRSYASQLNMTEADREKTAATIKLGYAQLENQFKMLMAQLGSNKDLLQMQLSSNELLAMLRLQFGL